MEVKCRVKKKLEQLNGFCKIVHVICLAEGEIDASK